MPANPAGAMRDSRDSRNNLDDLAEAVIFWKEEVFFFTRGEFVLIFMAVG